MTDFSPVFSKVKQDYQSTVEKQNEQAFNELALTLDRFEVTLREHIQRKTKDSILEIIKKINDGQELSKEDFDQLRLWIVGDAEYYTLLENSYQDWLNELNRLVTEINKLENKNPDVESASKLRAIVRDASRTIADIFYYIQQKERLEKFRSASQNLSGEDRTFLVKILEQKIKSPEF